MGPTQDFAHGRGCLLVLSGNGARVLGGVHNVGCFGGVFWALNKLM